MTRLLELGSPGWGKEHTLRGAKGNIWT